MKRNIVHLDLDTFFVSVERLQNSSLIGKPVLIGGTSDRGVVASCSYEARQFGVHSAMPMRMARQLCPHAIIVRGDYDQYNKYSKIITDILTEKAPVVEKASIDEHYLDLTGMDKHFGCYKWISEVRKYIIQQTGLPISFGLSINKTVSKIATGQAKPNGQLNIDLGTEKQFLAPLSIKKIPMVGDKAGLLLKQLGINTIGIAQKMPVERMEQALGENGVTIWKKANAIDNTPITPYSERKSISAEETFQNDTIDLKLLKKTIVTMIDDLAFELRKENRLTSCITLKIRYSNFDTHTQQCKIPYTSLDHVLLEKAILLFDKLYSRRMLIRLIGIKFSGLVLGHHQIDLFNNTEEQINLYQAIDGIKNRFGVKAVLKAVTL